MKTTFITLMLDSWSSYCSKHLCWQKYIYIYIYILDAIEWGSEKKLQNIVFVVCCGNESKIKKLWEVLVKKYFHILALDCSSHSTNLHSKETTPKNVMKYSENREIFSEILWRFVVKGHQRPQILNDTKENQKKSSFPHLCIITRNILKFLFSW